MRVVMVVVVGVLVLSLFSLFGGLVIVLGVCLVGSSVRWFICSLAP